MKHTKPIYFGFIAIFGLAYTHTALSTTTAIDPNAKLTVGVNVGYGITAYDADNDVQVLPHAFYDNNRFYLEGSEAGIYGYKDDTHQLRFGLSYDGRSFDPNDANGALKDLSKRDISILAHANYMYVSPIGGIRLKVAQDVLGEHNGTNASLSHISRFTLDNTTIYPSFGLNWYSKKYNDYYYGIDNNEAVASGLPAYEVGSSVSPFVSLMVNYDINAHWAIFGQGRIEWLDDNVKDSPMIDSDTYAVARLGVSYTFAP